MVRFRGMRLISSVALLAVALAAACSTAYSSDPPPPDVDAGDDAPAPVTHDDNDATVDPCAHHSPPPPPDKDDAPDVELPTFFMAARTISLGSAMPGGFDLDGVCSCDKDPGTAFDGGAACKAPSGGTGVCDLDGGVDNSASVLTAQLSPFFAIDTLAQKIITAGRRTLLIQIGKYNGELNDKEVAVGLAMSDGIRSPGCPGSVQDPVKGTYSPGWCGTDTWSLLSSAVIPGSNQPYLQTLGYVSNGVLVFRQSNIVSVPFDEAESLDVSGSIVTGTLTPLGEDLQPRPRDRAPTDLEKRLWAVNDGTFGARTSVSDLLEALGTLAIPHDGGATTHLCNEALFPALRSAVCNGRDIPTKPEDDHNLDKVCDALSLAMAVTTFPVLAGDVRDPTPETTECTPDQNGVLDGGLPYVCP